MSSRRKKTYEQNKIKAPYQQNWKDMKMNKREQRNTVFYPSKFKNYFLINKDIQGNRLQGKGHLWNVGYEKKITFPFSVLIIKISFTTFNRIQLLDM